MTEHSPLPWTIEQDEPPDECWWIVSDANSKPVCFGTKDDMELVMRVVNTHQPLVDALERAHELLVVGEVSQIISAALAAAKGDEG